jgi:hypothetical protein
MTPQILVIDVPASMTPEEATAALSEPTTRGYYLRSLQTNEPLRAIFCQHAPDANEAECAEDLRAMDLVKANRKQTAMRLVQILAENKIHRGSQWVAKAKDEL